MEAVSFADAHLQVVATAGGGREIVLATLLSGSDARTLAEALAWQRTQDHQVATLDTPEAVLAFRALATLIDEIETIAEQDGGPVMLTEAQVATLAESAARYVAARHSDEHLPARETERIERLRSLMGPLFERVSQLAGAREELEHGTGRC
jgi:ABC-type branched-subunit amino acid transport system ATPase component